MTALTEASTLHLMIELIYEGRAGFIEEMEKHEPLDMEILRKELAHRAGQTFGSPQNWVTWYLSAQSPATERDRNTLDHVWRTKRDTDHFIK